MCVMYNCGICMVYMCVMYNCGIYMVYMCGGSAAVVQVFYVWYVCVLCIHFVIQVVHICIGVVYISDIYTYIYVRR